MLFRLILYFKELFAGAFIICTENWGLSSEALVPFACSFILLHCIIRLNCLPSKDKACTVELFPMMDRLEYKEVELLAFLKVLF
jgi:hypothetical protein